MRSLLRFLKYVKPYMKLVVLTFVCLVIGLGLELLLPRLLGLVVDRGIAAGDMAVVARLCITLTIAAVFRALLRYGQSYSQERVGQEALRDLRRDLYAKLQRLSFSYYTVHATGDQMSRLTSDLYAVMDFLGFGLSEMISAGIFFAGTMGVLLVIDWHLALALLAPVPLLMFFAFRFSGRIGPLWERIRQEMGNMTTTLQENVSGVRVVKAFAQEPQEIVKFKERNMATLSAHVARAGVEAQTFPLLNVISGICLLILYWYGGRRVIRGQTSLGTYVSFSWYLWGFIWPIRYLGFLIGVARQATAAAPRIFAILDSEMEIAEGSDAHEAPSLEGEIHFEEVSFAFPDGDGTFVLKHLDLCVHPGETIAILGRTGSGKSSLMQLIPRFYDVDEGRVTIDGIDVRDVTLESLRQQIGIVPQETFLFSDTVRNNIALGHSDANLEEIQRVARAAQAHAFISELPDGYDTRVGERGIGLSGGQKQRVAIARALLIDPRILLLDEPTSSVDAETEHELQMALAELMEGRTSIVIAQRLSTVKSADRLIVLRDGGVVEEGSHRELLAKGGEYKAIYEAQFRSQADGDGSDDSIADEDDALTETKVAEE